MMCWDKIKEWIIGIVILGTFFTGAAYLIYWIGYWSLKGMTHLMGAG
jgi:hypothetical protein